VNRYAGYTTFDPPLVLIFGSRWLAWAIAAILLVWAVWIWRQANKILGRNDVEQPGDAGPKNWTKDDLCSWILSLLVVVSALIAPRTSQANQLVLLLPLFFVFSRLRHSWLIALIELVLLAGLWLIDLAFLPPTSDALHMFWQHRVISPILPLGLVMVLLWIGFRLASHIARTISTQNDAVLGSKP
jgi:hypothetical protein